MKIISNERYRKLLRLEMDERVKIDRGYDLEPKEGCNIEERIQWILRDRILQFMSSDEYSQFNKLKKGEIGRIYGFRIIIEKIIPSGGKNAKKKN